MQKSRCVILEYFDGFSIGSNDMTQLALGLDRDSGVVSELFDERNDAVKALLSMAIRAAKKQGKYVGPDIPAETPYAPGERIKGGRQ